MTEQGTLGDEAGYYRISEDAQLRLTQVFEQLTLLAALAAPIGHDTGDGIWLQPSALAQCFAQLANALQESLTVAEWHPA